MVVTETLIAIYLARRALAWYRDDPESERCDTPLEDHRDHHDHGALDP